MGALPARVTLVPLRSFWDRINHRSGHGVPDFEISARTKVNLLETKNLKGHKSLVSHGNMKCISFHEYPTCIGNLVKGLSNSLLVKTKSMQFVLGLELDLKTHHFQDC